MTAANLIDRVCGTIKRATTAIILTHNIDFLFIQSVLLPRLWNLGHPKLTVLADAASAAGSFQQQMQLIEGLGTRYRVVSVDLGPGRRFHPKAFLLAGPQGATLAVGSGNLTHGGWSANREIWSDYAAPGDGSSAFAAFRDYLTSILDFLPAAGTVVDDVMSTFDTAENPWAAELPEPGNLLGSPSDTPLLDRMLAFAGEGIDEVTVLSPYFDEDGVALSEIAKRTAAPVTARIQPKQEGLSSRAAARLPGSVSLGRADIHDGEGRQRFIHAKLYSFKKSQTTFLVAGSANCSQAGLLAANGWGNAELVAAWEIPNAAADALLSELEISDEWPDLPEVPPSEEWEFEPVPLRILAARRDGRRIDVAFKSAPGLTEFALESDGGAVVRPCAAYSAESLVFEVDGSPRSIRLRAHAANGSNVISAPMWVDDERALGIPLPERRLRERIQDAGHKSHWTPSEYLEILELFDQHLRQPAKTRLKDAEKEKSKAETVGKYTADDVFSEGFGRAPPAASRMEGRGEFNDEDFLSLFMSFFSTEKEPTGSNPSPKPPITTEGEGEPEDEEKKLLEGGQKKYESVPSASLRNRMVRAIDRVAEAMSDASFVARRSPSRLAADLGSTALLMRKALSDGHLTVDEYKRLTGRLWQALFFGLDGQGGTVPDHIESLNEKEAFITDLASPRLSAAMALWCMPEWGIRDADGAWFRLSAAQLAVRLPWLAAGGLPEEVTGELARIAAVLLPKEAQQDLIVSWLRWMRSATALTQLEDALKGRPPKVLASMSSRPRIGDGELLWQAGKLYVAVGDCVRTGNATVRALGRRETSKFTGRMLAPVSDLLDSDLGLSPAAVAQLRELLVNASAKHVGG